MSILQWLLGALFGGAGVAVAAAPKVGGQGTARPTILKGDGTWGWVAEIDGEDIVIRNATVTCFGGTDDPQDNGETASGVSTRSGTVLGCALPRCWKRPSHNPESKEQANEWASLEVALAGSPIPSGLPFQTLVEFGDGSSSITVPFIDLGPAKRTGHAGDLTAAAARHFDPKASSRNFEKVLTIRIHGGAKYVV